jgi:hypothetical protein
MKRVFIPLAFLLLLLCGCSVTEEIGLSKPEATASANTSATFLEVQDFFIDVLGDYEEFADEAHPTKAMDNAVDTLAQSLKQSGGASEVSFYKIGDRMYQGTFVFNDIATLLTDLGASKGQTILTKNGNTLSFHLDLQNYGELQKVVPFLKDKNFEPFGATYNEGMSEEDYLDMVTFMLGDNAPEAIKNSRIDFYVKTPGAIVSQQNGTLVDENTFCFSFRLIDFLLLSKPIECSVTWR